MDILDLLLQQKYFVPEKCLALLKLAAGSSVRSELNLISPNWDHSKSYLDQVRYWLFTMLPQKPTFNDLKYPFKLVLASLHGYAQTECKDDF